MIRRASLRETLRYGRGQAPYGSGHVGPIAAARSRGTPADLIEVFAASGAPLFYWHMADTEVWSDGSALSKTTGAGSTPAIVMTGGADWFRLWIEVVTGGTLGNAIFDISFDGGTTVHMAGVTSAATINLTGLGSGKQLACAAGTYILNDVYEQGAADIADRGAGNHDIDQGAANAAASPLIADGADGPNGARAIIGEQGRHWLRSDFSIPAPGTTPLFLTGLIRIEDDTTGDTIFSGSTTAGGGTASFRLFNNAGAFTMFNTTNRAPAVTAIANVVGEWLRFYCYFSNSAADYLHVGGSGPATVASAGNSVGESFRLGRNPNGSNAGAVSCAEISGWQFLPDAGELSDADDYYSDVYGASVLTAA